MVIVIGGLNRELEEPNICPHCHVVNEPSLKWFDKSRVDDSGRIFPVVWLCANKDCKEMFVAEYVQHGFYYNIKRFLNGLPKGPDWPKPIVNLKSGSADDNLSQSKFIETYLQSLEAEHLGLNEIAGMGFRKSIEYLVKDWAIQNNPEDKEKVEALWLGQVINNYYSGDLKDILERATWLGNDQSHYNKLFGEYDTSDLKELIDLIMVELDRQFKMKHYIDTIQKRK